MGLIKSSIITLSARIALFIISVFISIITARILGPVGKGEYSFIILIPLLIINLGNLGVGTANVYFIGKGKYKLSNITSNSLILAFFLGTLLSTFALIFIKYTHPLFLKEINFINIFIAHCAIPFSLLVIYFKYILLGKNNIKRYNLLDILQTTFLLGFLIIALIILRQGVFGAVLSYVLAAVLTSFISIFWVNKLIRIKMSLNFKLLKDSLVFGIKGHLGNIAQFLNYRLDMFLVMYFLGAMYLGYYSIAVVGAEMLWHISSTMAIVLLPKISSLDAKEANKLTPVICRHTFFITTGMALVLFILSRFFIFSLYGRAYLPSVKPLCILLPGIVIFSIPKVLASDIIGRGKPIINTYAALASLVINIMLNLFLIPKWGISGAAFASSIAYFVGAGIILRAFLKISGSSLIDTLLIKKSDFKIYTDVYFRIMSKLQTK